MGSDTATGEDPALPEDTLDLGERLDPVRTLLRRTAAGDRDAASALVDVLGPRIHGLAVHVTGSSARAGRLTVWVLRTCVRDAAQLASGGLPGEAAVLDRARRAAVATRPSGDVRSLVAPDTVTDRTRDRREVDVVRALLALPPVQRALVESAAQGRFPYSGPQRPENAGVLAGMLDELVPFGGPESAQLRGLAALDALALADEGERARLRELTAGSEAAAVHRHAIEAAARLTLLTALPPTRDLHADVLDPLEGGPSAGPEAAYHGTYATPVLGTDTQRRMVGPPAMAGGPQTGRAGAATPAPAAPRSDPRATSAHPGTAPAPVFSFRPSDEAGRTRRQRRRQARAARPARGAPWLARSVAALALVAVLVLAWVVIDTRAELASSREAAATWSALSTDPEAQLVRGLSDNGTWRAVLTDDGLALRAEGVDGYDGEVLQLWGESDGAVSDLGVLELSADGLITHSSSETAERLLVTRENAPQNRSGTPSARVVANLDPGLPGG
ncbi:MAG TPA: hypothetical protein H9786_00410 [Candidatus Brachybacterium merdavium]|uniref:Uncharacterized protein n=1 Tax=Candidatus Brachybacterium merdavium TaxID=2838513 RepID=A0A9D2LAI8_9MICO|nr:hypothetical protein [Candidatus Brachybacterium merdavium]